MPTSTETIIDDYITPDKLIYSKGFGVRELGKPNPVTPNTLMMASSSKPLTALMMETVMRDDLMTWDSPVISIFPGFEVSEIELTNKLTMSHLVCSCSGILGKDRTAMRNA